MEACGRPQTVFGFGCGLDWWPTVFRNAFPPTMVCRACGRVSSKSGSLPCGHVLCNRCYYPQCAERGGGQCPLDGCVHRGQDVVWSTFTAESILSCKIHCWNARSGCDAVGPASAILVHFHDHCQYHVVACQRCSRTMTQKEIVDHLRFANCVQGNPQAPPTLQGVGAVSLLKSLHSLDQRLTESTRLSLDAIKDIHDAQTSLERNMSAVRQFSRAEIEGMLGQLESRVGRMCSENTVQVLAASGTIKAVTDALKAASLDDKQHIVKAWQALQETINKRSGIEERFLDMKKQLDEKFNVVTAASKAVLEKKFNSSEPFEWTVGGWSKLKDRKSHGERAINWAKKPGFFYGYYILPGAEIADIEGTLSLRMVFQVCKGFYDQLLPWPLEKGLNLKVLHPSGGDSVVCGILSTKDSEAEALRMPCTVQRRILSPETGVPIRTLEANGYNVNDEIRVRFEVFP